MGKKKKKKTRGKVQNNIDGGPLTLAILSQNEDEVRSILSNIFREDISEIILTKHLGDVYTGGRSNPVWQVDLHSANNDSLILKATTHEAEPDTDRKRIFKQSFQFEMHFYRNLEKLSFEQNWKIPKIHHIESTRRTFSLLMENLRTHYPHHIWPEKLPLDTAILAMRWLANFHASFWEQNDMHKRLHVWQRGCFWLNLPASEKIISKWDKTIKYMKKKNSSLVKSISNLVPDLEALDSKINNFFRIQKKKEYVTLLHGDFKAANMFFNDTEAAVCDFQFVGAGYGAADVMYFIAWDYFEIEEELMQVYYSSLADALDWKIKAYTFETFQTHYHFCLLAFFRYHLQRHTGWSASTESDVQLLQRLVVAIKAVQEA